MPAHLGSGIPGLVRKLACRRGGPVAGADAFGAHAGGSSGAEQRDGAAV